MSATPAPDIWLNDTVPAFMAEYPVYNENPLLAFLLDALVRETEETTPDISLDAALLRATHDTLVSQARVLLAATEPAA